MGDILLDFNPMEAEQETITVRTPRGVYTLAKDVDALIGLRVAGIMDLYRRSQELQLRAGSEGTPAAKAVDEDALEEELEEELEAIMRKLERRTFLLCAALFRAAYPEMSDAQVREVLPRFAQQWQVVMAFFTPATASSSPPPDAGTATSSPPPTMEASVPTTPPNRAARRVAERTAEIRRRRDPERLLK